MNEHPTTFREIAVEFWRVQIGSMWWAAKTHWPGTVLAVVCLALDAQGNLKTPGMGVAVATGVIFMWMLVSLREADQRLWGERQ